jgi:alanine racemase
MHRATLRPSPIRPTVATIDLRAVADNYRAVRRVVGTKVGVVAVVKADAYGHGAVPVARLLEGLGVWGFAVATAEEGVQLRDAGIRARILVMGAAFGDEHGKLVARELTPVVGDAGDVEHFAVAAKQMGRTRFGIHVKVDTGMTRLGVTEAEFEGFIRTCARYPWIRVDGLATHFACAELPSPEATQLQLDRFVACLDKARALGADPQWIHAANSSAALRFPKTRFDLVRIGIALYGALPGPHVADPGLRPALCWKTRINALREVPVGTPVSYGATYVTQRPSRIATLPVGYADGYPRRVGGVAQVQVVDRRGRLHRAPVIGRVCMDLCMVDVTEVEGIAVGDTVILLGGCAPEAIHPAELAQWAGTIPYEIWVGISKRVPRLYPDLDAAELGLGPGEER